MPVIKCIHSCICVIYDHWDFSAQKSHAVWSVIVF